MGLLAGYGLLAGLAAICLMYATRMAPVSVVAPTQYSQMLWAIAFGYLLFLTTWTGRWRSASH